MLGVVVRVAVTAILGLAIGFFVAVSGFADGPTAERAVVIGVILVAYALAGWCLGYRASRWYGLGLALPGLIVLLLYAGDAAERWWHLAYAALIVAVAMLGAHGGVRLGQRRA